MDPTDQELQQAQKDIQDYLDGTKSDSVAQGKAQAAQAFLNFATKPVPQTESSADKQTRQLAVQNAREAWQETQNAKSLEERQAIATARDQTQKDIAAGRVQSATDVTNLRGQYAEDIAAGRNQTSRDVAGIRAGSSIDVAGIRAGATTEVAGIRAGAQTGVANINAASRLADIQARADSQLKQLDQKFEQNLQTLNANEALKKDFYSFNNQLMIVRDEHLQQAMAIRTQAQAELNAELERPYKEAAAAAETSRAQTEAARQESEARNQQQQRQAQIGQMQLGAAQEQSKQAESAIQSGVKLGVAPPMALVKAQFAPYQMAQQILQQLAASGQIDPSRVPDTLTQGTAAPTGAPQPTGAPPAPPSAGAPSPLGQFSGYGTPGGYQGAPNPNVFGSGTGAVPPPTLADSYAGAPLPQPRAA